MPISEDNVRAILGVLRKHLDQAALEKIMDDMMELRGDKEFRDAVNLFVRLIQTD